MWAARCKKRIGQTWADLGRRDWDSRADSRIRSQPLRPMSRYNTWSTRLESQAVGTSAPAFEARTWNAAVQDNKAGQNPNELEKNWLYRLGLELDRWVTEVLFRFEATSSWRIEAKRWVLCLLQKNSLIESLLFCFQTKVRKKLWNSTSWLKSTTTSVWLWTPPRPGPAISADDVDDDDGNDDNPEDSNEDHFSGERLGLGCFLIESQSFSLSYQVPQFTDGFVLCCGFFKHFYSNKKQRKLV